MNVCCAALLEAHMTCTLHRVISGCRHEAKWMKGQERKDLERAWDCVGSDSLSQWSSWVQRRSRGGWMECEGCWPHNRAAHSSRAGALLLNRARSAYLEPKWVWCALLAMFHNRLVYSDCRSFSTCFQPFSPLPRHRSQSRLRRTILVSMKFWTDHSARNLSFHSLPIHTGWHAPAPQSADAPGS